MARRPPAPAPAALAAASVLAFALARGAWPLLLVVPVMAASLFWRIERLPRLLATALMGAGWLLVATIAVLPVSMTFYGFVPRQILQVALPAGIALCGLVTLYLFSAPGWTLATTTLPASLALLAAAGLQRGASGVVWVYALAAAALVAHLAWDRKLRAAPMAVFCAGAAAVAAGIALLLPWAQPWVEGKAGILLGTGGTARGGMSLTSRLGDVEELAESQRVALRAWTNEPQNLRVRVYTRFDGRAWNLPASTARRAPVPAPALEPDLERWLGEVPGRTYAVPGAARGPREVRTRIVQDLDDPSVLPAPSQVAFVRIDPSPGWVDFAGVLAPVREAPAVYAVVNRREGDVAQPGGTPEDETLAVPSTLDPRLRELAARLEAGADPVERIRRTMEYLGANCVYSLKVGAFRSSDPVGEFVFDKRRGYCEYFASAAATLLRLQGVHARYVVGFSVRPSNLVGGHYVVRDSDAHAWVEAHVPGRGWIEVDPTPASQFEEARAPLRGGAWAGFWERVAGWFAELAALVRQGGVAAALRHLLWPVIVLLAVVGAVVALRKTWRRRRPGGAAVQDARGVPPELLDLMRALDRLWKRSGHPRPASRAPLEHLATLPAGQRPGAGLVETFYRCVYGGVTPSPAELSGLRRTLSDDPSR